jgi:ABC-type multidrug transport system fused ATPase/permease subunit
MSANNMKDMTDEAFKRVQTFSADWHADSFAGSTVRRLSRAMWGYDVVTDAALIWFGPAAIVLVGLCVMMACSLAAGWPLRLRRDGALYRLQHRADLLLRQADEPAVGGAGFADRRAIADSISSNATVKAFGAESREDERISGVTEMWRKADDSDLEPVHGPVALAQPRPGDAAGGADRHAGLAVVEGARRRRRHRLRDHLVHADDRLSEKCRRQHPHGAARPRRQ